MKKGKTYIISLGGSLIVPSKGIDWKYLKKFRELILKQTRRGNKFIITVGGGTTARIYQETAKKITSISPEDLDWVGIYASRLNANLVRSIFKNTATQKVINDPTVRVKTKKKVIIAGAWKPGWSTDFVATMLAQEYRVKTIINLSNIDYVYDRDPKRFKNAEKIKEIKWTDFTRIVGTKWSPGLNAPFDPIATQKAGQLKLKVIIANGKKLKNLENILNEKKFNGTVVK